jgi:thiol-disulfide isomerase/thioredoxin
MKIKMKNANLKIVFKVMILFALIFSFGKAQSQDSSAKKKIPPFRIEQVSGDSLFSKDLKKNMQSMIVYFDPTCEHCQAFTRSLLEQINSFKNTQIVYITYTPISEVEKFKNDFSLDQYSNFKIGTEGYSFVVQKFYSVMRFPFIALYNKKGSLISFYREAPTVDLLIKQFQTAN